MYYKLKNDPDRIVKDRLKNKSQLNEQNFINLKLNIIKNLSNAKVTSF